MPLRHAKVSSKPDGADNTLIQPSDWNADHHIPGQSDGDIIVRVGGEWTRLPIGTAGQVLRVSSGAPAWQDVPEPPDDSVSTAKIQNGAVTYAKLQSVSAARLLGRQSGSSGTAQEIAASSPLVISGTNLQFDQSASLNNNARVTVENNGTVIGTRRALNLIPGTGISISAADDAANEEVDVTISSSGGVATDPIWDAAGDLAVGTGDNTAARLARGSVNGMQLAVVSNAVAWDRDWGGMWAMAPWMPSPSTNWRSLVPVYGTGTTLALTSGRCYFMPFFVSYPIALTDIGLEVSTASAGSGEIAIYASSTSTWRPTSRLVYWSGLNMGSATLQSTTVSVTLQPGLYWAALRSSSAATVRANANPFSWGFSSGGNNRATHLFNSDSSLADPVGSDPTNIGVGTIPQIIARWTVS